MTDTSIPTNCRKAALTTGTRGALVRRRILDAAERLLRNGKPDFSMRELAAAASVSFATPFNHFGSKAAIMHALTARRFETIAQRFTNAPGSHDAAGQVYRAMDVAVAVMLEEPNVNRAVMGWAGIAGPTSGQVRARSTVLWTLALGAGEGLAETTRDRALRFLPRQLAFAFAGVMSFWTAGELSDEALGTAANDITHTLMLGFSTHLSEDETSRLL